MRFPDDLEKYSNRWRYIELARYVPNLNRVIREQVGPKDDKKPVVIPRQELDDYVKKNNGLGLYRSVWYYNDKDPEKATRLGSLYFDLDSEDISIARDHARVLVEFFLAKVPKEAIRVYFTGAKGFHVEIEALALGIAPSNDLPEIYRTIATDLKEGYDLETIDFAVYDLRRMWRIVNTKHQKSGLYKVPCFELVIDTSVSIEDLKKYAEEPREEEIEEQTLSLEGSEWYREYVYKHEEEEEMSVEERIARFNKSGSGGSIRASSLDDNLEFDPKRLFDGCPAILRHWKEAEDNHHLSHEARLFLCSLLTYNDEAIWYLHQIFSLCDDYNPDITQAHINDWVNRRERGIGGRPYSCDRANATGVGCGNCDLEPRKKLQKIGDSYVESDEYAAPSPMRFAYKRSRNSV